MWPPLSLGPPLPGGAGLGFLGRRLRMIYSKRGKVSEKKILAANLVMKGIRPKAVQELLSNAYLKITMI